MKRLQGQGVSAGIAVGEALVIDQRTLDVRYRLPPSEVAAELTRLATAAALSRDQLRALRRKVARTGSEHASLFDAQLLMLDDPMLVGRARELVQTTHVNSSWAIMQAFDELVRLFDGIEDPYLRERSGDVADVVRRLLVNLRDGHHRAGLTLPDRAGPFVLVAEELAASVAAQLDWDRVAGFALATGSWTHHTAILARSLGIPTAIALRDVTSIIQGGERVVVDGDSGEVIVDPPVECLPRAVPIDLGLCGGAAAATGPAPTLDGRAIRLEANIERPEDVETALANGACGIGLYRSEYLLAGSRGSVSEEAQLATYRRILESMHRAPVTIRTFDVADEAREPGVGRRRRGLQAIGLSVPRRDLLRCQLRALVRAARFGTLRIMFPFVAQFEELVEARAMLDEICQRQRDRGDEVPQITVGAMIEVPGAALTADLLARQVSFFSIGTNDLAQYCLAADRGDPDVSHVQAAFHPALLRLIRLVARIGRRHGVQVSVCGEMAADPTALALLIGLGVTEFSMRASAIPDARRTVARIRVDEARAAARRAMRGAAAGEVRALFAGATGLRVPAETDPRREA